MNNTPTKSNKDINTPKSGNTPKTNENDGTPKYNENDGTPKANENDGTTDINGNQPQPVTDFEQFNLEDIRADSDAQSCATSSATGINACMVLLNLLIKSGFTLQK